MYLKTTTAGVTSRYESLTLLRAYRIVRDVVAVAWLVAGKSSLQGPVGLNSHLLVVRRTSEKSVRYHSHNRHSADHDVPSGEVSGLGFVLRDYETRQKYTERAEDQANGSGYQRGHRGGLLVLGFDVLRHEDPVRHVTHEVEYCSEVVAHEGRVRQEALEGPQHVGDRRWLLGLLRIVLYAGLRLVALERYHLPGCRAGQRFWKEGDHAGEEEQKNRQDDPSDPPGAEPPVWSQINDVVSFLFF